MNKIAGTLYEILFKAEALQRGCHVATPEGDYLPYDLILDNGKRLHRIQVKGTTAKQQSGYKAIVGKGNSKRGKVPFAPNSFDFLALLVMESGSKHWYIIPQSELNGRLSVKVFANPLSKGRYEKFKHGWELIC